MAGLVLLSVLCALLLALPGASAAVQTGTVSSFGNDELGRPGNTTNSTAA